MANGDTLLSSRPSRSTASCSARSCCWSPPTWRASLCPVGEPLTPLTAENLFREGSDLRQKDFAGSAQRYLQAARVQLEALRAGQTRAGFDD